jgi:hypothetical protein
VAGEVDLLDRLRWQLAAGRVGLAEEADQPQPAVVAVGNQPIGGDGQPGGAVGTVGQQVELVRPRQIAAALAGGLVGLTAERPAMRQPGRGEVAAAMRQPADRGEPSAVKPPQPGHGRG